MRNPENNFNRQTNRRDTDWESVGDDNLERRRARRYKEVMQKPEAIASIGRKVMALVAAALVVTALAGGVAASGCSTHEIMDTDRAEKVEMIDVESVTLVDGPNIRRDPVIPNKEDGSNVIMDFGEEGQVAHVPYQGEVYYYHNDYDSNEGWYGFPTKEFADELFENAFIGKEEAEQLVKSDSDGKFWVKGDYVRVDKKIDG